MRSPFDVKNAGKDRYGWEAAVSTGAQASSPDQVAVFWNNSGELIAASPASSIVPGSYDMDITRLPAEFDLQAALNMRREKNLGVPPLSAQTFYLTVVPGYNERTRILALDGNALALRDDELADWLVEAERNVLLGTDNHPIFETALQDTVCVVSRLPNGLAAMTEVPRRVVEAMRDKLSALTGSGIDADFDFAVETPLRSAARYFLTAQPEGANALRPEKESEVTAFLLVTRAGFNYGLWSPSTGLFSEYGFPAPTGINQLSAGFQNYGVENDGGGTVRIVEQEKSTTENGAPLEVEQLEAYVRNAFDQLFLQLSPEKIEQLQLSGYAEVVWATEIGLTEIVSAIAAEYAERTGLNFFQMSVPVDEAIAGGLLFGSFNFGDDAVAGAEILPPVNLARDLLVLADTEETERRRMEEVYAMKRRSRAVMALAAVPVVVFAILLALIADLAREQIMLGFRDARADARTSELKPALDRRTTYESNLKWYQEFIKQVSTLRRQQPVGTGMLYELNPSYPFNSDPAFYVSELKLLPTGGVEIKGLARNKDAVTAFLRSLEFSGGSQSGSRLFSNLTYEVQEGVAQQQIAPTGGQSNLPTMAGSNLSGVKPAPGVIAWSIKGNYLPMAEFIPPDPAKNAPNKPNQPVQPSPAPNNQSPAAAVQKPN